MANSIDAVSDRDFVLEALSAAAITAVHLSRFAEEIVIWCSPGFGLISLSDRFTTGSSIMPQKRNPDAAELVRAKTGRIIGALDALLMVMKGLPLAYQKDMQEDKEGAMAACSALLLSLAAMTGMVNDMKPDIARMRAAAGEGYSTATDLADWLVRASTCHFGKRTTSPDASLPRPSVQKVASTRSVARGNAGDRAANHEGRFRRAVRRKLGSGAAAASAARRRRMCAGRLSDGSRRWRGNGPDGRAMLSPPQCRSGNMV